LGVNHRLVAQTTPDKYCLNGGRGRRNVHRGGLVCRRGCLL
jgi:hypothetical protein